MNFRHLRDVCGTRSCLANLLITPPDVARHADCSPNLPLSRPGIHTQQNHRISSERFRIRHPHLAGLLQWPGPQGFCRLHKEFARKETWSDDCT